MVQRRWCQNSDVTGVRSTGTQARFISVTAKDPTGYKKTQTAKGKYRLMAKISCEIKCLGLVEPQGW